MKYYAQIIVDGWVEVEVDAADEAEAKKKMSKVIEEMNFGELRDVAWDMNQAEFM